MNYTDKPVIPLVDAASICLLGNNMPVVGGALAHCVGRLQRINEAAHALSAVYPNRAQRDAALDRLLVELQWLGPLP